MAINLTSPGMLHVPKLDLGPLQGASFGANVGKSISINPMGCKLIDFGFFANFHLQIKGASSCAELQAIVKKGLAAVYGHLEAMANEMDIMKPLLELMKLPKTLGDLISWVAHFIKSFLTPYIKPYYTMASQIGATLSEVEQVVGMVTAVAGLFEGGCSLEIPSASLCTALEKLGVTPITDNVSATLNLG